MEEEKQTVVIIDDEPTTVLLLQTAVEPLAMVSTVSKSTDAFSLIKSLCPDLIVLDINMPELSGFDVCKQLKSSPDIASIPVIFVTSHNDYANERKALSLGAIDFISKPIDIELCRMRVKNHLLIQRQKKMLSQVNSKLEAERQQLSVTLKSIADGVISTNSLGEIVFINPVAQRLTGYCERDALSRPISEVMNLRDAVTNAPLLNPAIMALDVKRPVAASMNTELISRQGQSFRIENMASPIIDEKGDLAGAVTVFQDVSEVLEMSVKMTHLTHHDHLTGLPNRVLLHDRIEQAVSRSFASKQSIALLLLDIDNFKYLNDSLGHQVGDFVISTFAKRLSRIVGPGSTLARVGGDEFACLLTEMEANYSADGLAMACLQVSREPIDIDGQLHRLSLSIGISLYPQDAVNAEEMMRHADSAMYRSKSKGKDTFSFFSNELQQEIHRRIEIELKLRQAIESQGLVIFLQPKYDFDSKQIHGAESLVRIRDQHGNIIGPDDFIPLAEETGLIHEIGRQVLRKSCEFVARCSREGEDVKIAVNVAAKQLASLGFANEVKEIINNAGINPSSIELEVTESALMNDFEQTKIVLNELSALGVTLALDDFGTGYSSLSYLKQFPIDVLKIDRSFVIDMDKNIQSHDIVTAIVNLAQSLGLKIVAEGIETQSHFNGLKALGCQLGQGYFMCRPLEMEHFFAKYVDGTAVA